MNTKFDCSNDEVVWFPWEHTVISLPCVFGFPTQCKSHLLGWTTYFLSLSCLANLLLRVFSSGLPGTVTYFSRAEHRKDRFNCQSVQATNKTGPVKWLTLACNAHHWRLASCLSRASTLRLKQEEVVFAMVMPSFYISKRQKQLTQSSSEVGWRDERHHHQET